MLSSESSTFLANFSLCEWKNSTDSFKFSRAIEIIINISCFTCPIAIEGAFNRAISKYFGLNSSALSSSFSFITLTTIYSKTLINGNKSIVVIILKEAWANAIVTLGFK